MKSTFDDPLENDRTMRSAIESSAVARGAPRQAAAGPGISARLAAQPDSLRGKPSISTIGVILVALVVGYEWFISGFDKIVNGDFPAGLGEELVTKSEGTTGWYASFLDSAIIPNARFFGYVIEVSELFAGIALIAGPLIWLLAWDRISDRLRITVLLSMAVAAIGGAILAFNLHIANAASHPWLIPGAAFDEGIDLDIVLPAIQLVIAAVSIGWIWKLRRTAAAGRA